MFQGTSSNSGQKSTNEVIRLIDLRIADLHESIHVLKCQRNGHLPISKLPVEILSGIFLLHQQNVMDSERYVQVQTLDWIGISYVCRQWREIALNFSDLWIHIPCHHPRWAEEMVARSKQARLIVRVAQYDPIKYPSEAQFLKNLLQQHLSRIQVLEIRKTWNQLVEKLFEAIQPSSVPCLSTLSVLTYWDGASNTASLRVEILDSRLLNATSLRRVAISATVEWRSKLFNGLTHLRLGLGEDDMPRTQNSQPEFLDALRHMPTLQLLDLKGLVLPAGVDRSSLEPVHLPDLQDLSIVDTASPIAFFLRHVNFPSTTRTSIGCKHVLQLEDISPVLALLKRLLSERPNALKLDYIEFTFEDEDRGGSNWVMEFKGWVSAGFSSPGDPNSNPDFTFFLGWTSDQMDPHFSPIDELTVSIFGIFPQDDVVSLLVSSHYGGRHFIPFARKIDQLPALNTFRVDHIYFAPFLLELEEGDDPSMPTYPALRHLHFTNFRIDVFTSITLYYYLKNRSERGLGPEKLRVDLRGLAMGRVDKIITTLLNSVVDVVWVMDSDSEDSDSDSDSV